jgi:hypothetical protein
MYELWCPWDSKIHQFEFSGASRMSNMLQFIKLENFKSFKGEFTIGPFKKLNVIHGPTGSGTSNGI